MTSPTNPMLVLQARVLANDAPGLRQALESLPELKSRLNDPLPDDAFGATALIAAVRQASKEMIEVLLAAGADINARSHWWAGGFGVLDDDHGLTPYLIERGARVDAHAAARLGMLDTLEGLLRAEPGLVHARGGDGQTPLHRAATVQVADCLLDHGAEIDALDVDHESTPAQYLVRDHPEVVRRLIDRGCRTDLLMAAALGDLALARKHLDADPACLRVSVSEEYFPKKNPRAGGTIYIWTLGQHKTAHMVAREFGHEQMFELLMERSSEELKLSMACELGDEATFRMMLARNPNLTRQLSAPERRKIAFAAQNNNTDAVRLMLQAGWPVDARGQHRATPLHWAAFHGNVQMAELLLHYNPPLELRDGDFHSTPLGWAMHGSEHGWHRSSGEYPKVVEALLRAGASLPEEAGGTGAVKEVLRRYGLEIGPA